LEQRTGKQYMDPEPELPPVFQYLWDWFAELHEARGGGFGPSPLTWPEIDFWASRMRVDPTPWELRVIKRLDKVWLKSCSDKPEDEDDPPVGDE